ncbi:MAG: hypothetical protein KYX63_12775 [Alteromonas macleodii]|nr:hypothetical protein [Alteromonas macleodii]
MSKRFIVNLKSDYGKPTSINYTLLDNEAVDIWSSLWDGPATSEYPQTVSFSSGNIDPSKINACIGEFNSIVNGPSASEIPHFAPSDFSSDVKLLNQIHSMFEDFGYQLQSKGWLFDKLQSSDIRTHCSSLLDEINCNVHLLEGAVNDFYKPKTNTSCWLSLPFRGHDKLPMKDSLKDLFQLSSNFGDLFLGYATRGKNLQHIMKDNDVELLRHASATPQKYISKGVISLFTGDKETKWSENKNSSEEHRRKMFNEWFDENNIAQFGYKKDSIDNCLGYIKIGRFQCLDFQKDWTCEQVTQYYSKYSNFISAEIK